MFRTARSWGYNLDRIRPEVIARAPYDVFVIDYTRDGTDEQALTPAEVAALKKKPDGSRRVVLCYLSIGEAEDYRYYWRSSWSWIGWLIGPSWLGGQNSEWPGNFAVRYWDPGWQNVILGSGGYLDRILKAGFDGVYLDKIDSSIEPVARKNPRAKEEMAAFVKRIADKGRAARPGFLIVPQNGEELLPDAGYRAVIDGLGKEDLLYGELEDKKANPPEVTAKRLEWLRLLIADGKPVLAVEYLDEPARIRDARQKLEEYGMIPHFADRDLHHMRIGDLPEADRPTPQRKRAWRALRERLGL